MFTGIIERMGAVLRMEPGPSGSRLELDAQGWPERPQLGESIAVDGCCLTLAAVPEGRLAFDVVPQTMSRTTLGSWRLGRRVNLERSTTLATLLGGHLVQGHVDATGVVEAVMRESGQWRLRIEAPAEVHELLVPRGSISIDGVSLTVAELSPHAGAGRAWFEVALIPETLSRTTLGEREAGDRVNLEADAIAKLVDQAVRRRLERPAP